VQRPVGPVRVVLTGVLAEDQPQVLLAGDQHPVQALAPGAGDPAFGDGSADAAASSWTALSYGARPICGRSCASTRPTTTSTGLTGRWTLRHR
jgi:hypothetical protein